jgi:hypothetical protein
VKPWAKRIQLFLGEERRLFFHFWSKRGRGQKEEGHFWAKRVPPSSTIIHSSVYHSLFIRPRSFCSLGRPPPPRPRKRTASPDNYRNCHRWTRFIRITQARRSTRTCTLTRRRVLFGFRFFGSVDFNCTLSVRKAVRRSQNNTVTTARAAALSANNRLNVCTAVGFLFFIFILFPPPPPSRRMTTATVHQR